MLREIAIKNFAIIDDLNIRFSDGLTVLSGETGAGKSIIIQALTILLGSRADAGHIRSGEETAELEALFDIDPDGPASDILCEQGYERTSELLIRRILSKNNRHRIYINGRPATMQILSSMTDNLAGISGQHEHQRLLKETEHLLILDQFADLMPLRQDVQDACHDIMPMIKRLADLCATRQHQIDRLELLAFQQKEIEETAVSDGEDEALKQELFRLKNAERLHQSVFKGVGGLYDQQGAVAERLADIRKEIETAAQIDPALTPDADALADAVFRIEDITASLRSYLNGIQFDDRRKEEIEDRLDVLNRLKRKYGGSIEAVLAHLEAIRNERADIENIEERIARTEAALKTQHTRLATLAETLSKKRRTAARQLADCIETELHSLKMPDTRFSVAFKETDATDATPPHLCRNGKVISDTGLEQAAFMIAPNVGEDLKPLSKIASGGELSRVILALKAILVHTEPVGTVVFDEVDAGIGGETAEVVGKKLAALAAYNQVICITHLAQIAKFANHHFKITKNVENDRTATRIMPLDDIGRVEETARMIGRTSITGTTRAHAEELLKNTERPVPGLSNP